MSPRAARLDGQSARRRVAIKTNNSRFPRKSASIRNQNNLRLRALQVILRRAEIEKSFALSATARGKRPRVLDTDFMTK